MHVYTFHTLNAMTDNDEITRFARTAWFGLGKCIEEVDGGWIHC